MSKRLLLALCVGLPSSLWAQSVTMGSPLAADPNVSIDCAAQPAIADPSGEYGLFPSNVADCTWRQSGVAGVPNDTRFSSVPGNGTITSVSVRSGPNPAPLRFVIFRQLAANGDGTNSQCCFYVGESDTVQPQPNAITTFQTNLPVERNTLDGVLAVDLIGISAPAGAGTLPLLSVGPHNAFVLTQPGSVNAGFFYPRIGAIANDVGGGRREEGIPGFEVLIQWTWCPTGGVGPGCPGGGGSGGTSGIPGVRSTVAPVAGGRAPIDLVCNGNAVCRGLLELLATGRGRARAGNGGRYAKRKFTLQPGANGLFQMKLSGKAKRLLRDSAQVPVTLRVTPKKLTPFMVDMTLTR